MRRILLVAGCLALAVWAPPAVAKKHAKPKALGPVVTASAVGNTVTGIGNVSTASATCPARLQAVGGGFSAPSEIGSQMVVIDSYRSAPDTWTVDGVTGPGSNAATAFVYCRRNNHAISDVTGTAQVPAAENATGQANASCPGTTRLVGGGFQSTHGPSPADLAAVTTSFTGTSNRWTVAAFSSQGSAQTLTAHAYCMRGIRAPTTLSASVNTLLSNGVSATATSPSCPRARKAKPGKKRKKRPAQQLSGGGFFSPPVTTDMTHLITSSFASASGWATTELHATGTPSPAGLLSQGICV